jgi:hypothetical protein
MVGVIGCSKRRLGVSETLGNAEKGPARDLFVEMLYGLVALLPANIPNESACLRPFLT